jgi:hypothetical protein
MAFTDADVLNAQIAAAENAKRGVSGLTIGDRRIDYRDPIDQINAARMIAEDQNGGAYDVEFAPKGYFQ